MGYIYPSKANGAFFKNAIGFHSDLKFSAWIKNAIIFLSIPTQTPIVINTMSLIGPYSLHIVSTLK